MNRFQQRLDDHITGKNDPRAPFNQREDADVDEAVIEALEWALKESNLPGVNIHDLRQRIEERILNITLEKERNENIGN